MITRIVKMTFNASETGNFLQLFEQVKQDIRQVDGCRGLTLLEDVHNNNILFTYSKWESETHLNAYRSSELFERTWKNTKSKFSAKAEAWSVKESSFTSDNNLTSKEFSE